MNISQNQRKDVLDGAGAVGSGHRAGLHLVAVAEARGFRVLRRAHAHRAAPGDAHARGFDRAHAPRRRGGHGLGAGEEGVHHRLLSGQLRLSGAGDVLGAHGGRHRQGHAVDDGAVAGQRHAGRAAGASDGAAREHLHRPGHLRGPGPHRPGQGGA